MAYDEDTAARVRGVLAGRRDVVERRMFGGLCFMVNGAMCCGLTSEAMMVRVGPAGYEAALAQPHARPMDFTGRPLRGMVYVDPQGYRTAAALRAWIARGLAFVAGAGSVATAVKAKRPTPRPARTVKPRPPRPRAKPGARGAKPGARRKSPRRAR